MKMKKFVASILDEEAICLDLSLNLYSTLKTFSNA